MKLPVILLSSALLLAGAGSGLAQTAAPTDPFQRTAPAAGRPSVTAQATATPTAPITLPGVQNATFGSPRASSQGSATRVVFDLPAGVTYSLTPTFTGLRVDVQGARVQPAVTTALGSSVTEYRAGGGQATLFTPFPLSLNGGWKAQEATLATGSRVLIIDIGAGVTGGAPGSRVLTSAPVTPAAQAVLNGLGTPLPAASLPAALPPGDTVQSGGKVLPPAPALPGGDTARPSALTGRVPGAPRGDLLAPPRLGKSPGQTRVVLDLPSGATYRITPGPSGLSIELTGLSVTAQGERNASPELREWRSEPRAGGGVVTLLTAAPTTARSGWRAQLLPPASGDLHRLAIDLSPAMADLTPLLPAERVVTAVPPVLATRGTALLALSASFVKPRVVIDPGHGGRDPGAVGRITEKAVNLDIALRVRELLTAAGVDVVLTRDSDRELHPDKNTDLKLRAALGTPGTALFVSIHVNALDAVSALRGYGIETWWNPNHPRSSALASLLQGNMVAQTGAFNRGLKNTQSLSVLRNSRVPAALVEVGYLSHPVDSQNLTDSHYIDRVALGIAQGVREALVSGVTADADASSVPLAGTSR